MRRTVWTALAFGSVALAYAVPAQAQAYRWDFGINGGYSWYSESLDEEHFFFNDDDDFFFFFEDVSAEFDDGWLAGAQLTYWVPNIFGWEERLGLRANFAYTERPFDVDFDVDGGIDGIDLDFDEFEAVSDVNLWSGTFDLLFRFARPNPRGFRRVEWLPYLALGIGAKWINPAGGGEFGTIVDLDDLIEDGIIDGDIDGVIFGLGDRFFVLEEETKLMGLVGLGTDVRLSRHFALRAEIGDRIWDSPLRAVTFDPDDDIFFIDEDDDVGKVIHEIYGQLGIHYLFGLEAPEEVAVVAPPAPPPPAEEAITVCVIDPSMPGGIGNIRAVYMPSTGDTLVTVNGQRVAIDRAFQQRVVVAEDADWYIRGEPLAIVVDGERAEFVTYGGARVIGAEDVAYLGTVNGLPVYADEDEVQDIYEEIEELREAQRDDDLEDILERRDDLREDFDDLEVLYVPLQPVGCVFQPVRRVEEVRKIRG